MSILEKYTKALEAKDEAAMNEIIHDAWVVGDEPVVAYEFGGAWGE